MVAARLVEAAGQPLLARHLVLGLLLCGLLLLLLLLLLLGRVGLPVAVCHHLAPQVAGQVVHEGGAVEAGEGGHGGWGRGGDAGVREHMCVIKRLNLTITTSWLRYYSDLEEKWEQPYTMKHP